MSNYESIPADTRTAIDTLIHNDNSKNAIGRLWKLYLRVNTYDTEHAEQDLQDSCDYIVDQTCRAAYGDNYKEKDLRFDMRYTPFTVRMAVDFFIEWIKIRAEKQKNDNLGN
jgi:hypothetical protein